MKLSHKLKARAWLRRFIVILVILFGSVSSISLVVGLCLIVLGLFLHIWAICCLVRNTQLTTWGPYRFVRHPFYLANFLIDIGICSASANPYIFGIYIILFYLIYYRRMLKEEQHLTQLFPLDYPLYTKSVPRFIPLIFKKYPKSDKGFSFSLLIAAGNEITRVTRLLIYPLVLYFLFRRFPDGIISGYRKVYQNDIITGLINYQEIIIISIIIVFSVVSILVKTKTRSEIPNPKSQIPNI
ncbi:MAG: isoprenylcysteine carboxylmethyltransferase family protein [Planctomycetota bacterium]|nr:isoprenylcysteine carboxylmethyltransferase family protein [Planctomycetota bacterium]